MELFRDDGCLTDAGLHALAGQQLDELGRLEAAEHLAYCNCCLERYTALLAEDVLEQPPESLRGPVLRTIWARVMQNVYGRIAVAGVAAVLALTLWRGGAFEWIFAGGDYLAKCAEQNEAPKTSVSALFWEKTGDWMDQSIGRVFDAWEGLVHAAPQQNPQDQS